MEEAPRIELGMKVLQTSALPLGYAAIYGAENEARTRDPHLGKVVLYHCATSALVVLRDGIEPPTRGFSVPCSTD